MSWGWWRWSMLILLPTPQIGWKHARRGGTVVSFRLPMLRRLSHDGVSLARRAIGPRRSPLLLGRLGHDRTPGVAGMMVAVAQTRAQARRRPGLPPGGGFPDDGREPTRPFRHGEHRAGRSRAGGSEGRSASLHGRRLHGRERRRSSSGVEVGLALFPRHHRRRRRRRRGGAGGRGFRGRQALAPPPRDPRLRRRIGPGGRRRRGRPHLAE